MNHLRNFFTFKHIVNNTIAWVCVLRSGLGLCCRLSKKTV